MVGEESSKQLAFSIRCQSFNAHRVFAIHQNRPEGRHSAKGRHPAQAPKCVIQQRTSSRASPEGA
jgi:hypothetical protein